ncbi:MAG: copper amine oxidase N-terminal domain-containing protein [Syntrophomonadaceae bacterium]|nr:copper amine oxidase N-terminal domain-containing protein [Syntrophomonadaceae bacterium]
MNRLLKFSIYLIGLLLLSIGGGNQALASGNTSFEVGSTSYSVDGVANSMDVAPYIKDGRTYVPVAYLAKAMGIPVNNVVWDAQTAKVTLTKGDQTLQMQIGNKTLLVNGAARQMDVAPEITSGRTFLPASFVAQGFGYSVNWDAASQIVSLYQGSSLNSSVNNTDPQSETSTSKPGALSWEDWPAATTDDPNHAWTVVFKQPMQTSTVNNYNIYVSIDVDGSRRLSGVGVTASDSTHALVSPPAGGWSAGSTYYLIITQSVLTSSGQPLKDTVRMPFSIQSAVILTPDYWIPDLTRQYYFDGNDFYRAWTQQEDNNYQCEILPWDIWPKKDHYAIKGGYICWLEGEGGGSHEYVTSGQRIVLAPVSPGQSWQSTYTLDSGNTYYETGTFIGMEEISILGAKMMAAHIHVKEGATYEYDQWLVKNMGMVKRESYYQGILHTTELTGIK